MALIFNIDKKYSGRFTQVLPPGRPGPRQRSDLAMCPMCRVLLVGEEHQRREGHIEHRQAFLDRIFLSRAAACRRCSWFRGNPDRSRRERSGKCEARAARGILG